ncbi:hypothetical protein ATANTOWER_001896 [Ataeniobius toweri]|uniref:Uncharacterized protein n=1 Tax=Ataeniobius toweri TaxID=208326 RepID=A0ABU7C8E3_9TELE|nr:hypothetical protein [Ataeniobius toweri]
MTPPPPSERLVSLISPHLFSRPLPNLHHYSPACSPPAFHHHLHLPLEQKTDTINNPHHSPQPVNLSLYRYTCLPPRKLHNSDDMLSWNPPMNLEETFISWAVPNNLNLSQLSVVVCTRVSHLVRTFHSTQEENKRKENCPERQE